MTYEPTNSFRYLGESNHCDIEYNLHDYNSYAFGSPTYSASSSMSHHSAVGSVPHSLLDDDIPEIKGKYRADTLFRDPLGPIKRESSHSPLPESSISDIYTHDFTMDKNNSPFTSLSPPSPPYSSEYSSYYNRPLSPPPYSSEYSSYYSRPSSPPLPRLLKTRTSFDEDDEPLGSLDSQSITYPYCYSLPPLTCCSPQNSEMDFPFAYNPNQSYPHHHHQSNKKYHHHPTSSSKTKYVQSYEKVLTTAPRRYQCTLCIKRFTRPSSLATHMHSHTGEKPYQCEVNGCGRRFSVVSNLRRHAKIHLQSS